MLTLYKFAKKHFKLLYLIFILKSPIYPGVGDLNFENPGGPGGGGLKISWGSENPTLKNPTSYLVKAGF